MQIKAIIIAVAVIAVISTIGGIYASLKMDISELEQEKLELKEANANLMTELAAERLNVSTLKDTITKVNNDLSKLEINNKSIETELKKWKDGYVEVTNKNETLTRLLDNSTYTSTACQDGLIINQLIGELKYEDL